MKLFIVLFLMFLSLTGLAQEGGIDPESTASFLQEFLSNYAWGAYVVYVLMGLGTLMVLATTVIKMTKTTTDDEFLAKIEANPIGGFFLGLINAFSLVNKDKK